MAQIYLACLTMLMPFMDTVVADERIHFLVIRSTSHLSALNCICHLCPYCFENYFPSDRKRFDNITVLLYKGLSKPDLAKMLLKRFEMVVNLLC